MAGSPANSHGNGYPLALAGAVSATRFVGGTATVAPTTGTFAVGDFVISQNGKLWVCTAAGSPGTWVQVGSYGYPSAPANFPEAPLWSLSAATSTIGANAMSATPFWVYAPLVVNRLVLTVAVQNGNIDLGIYAGDGAAFAPSTLLVSSGSIACPAAGVAVVTVAATTLPAGFYWAAVAANGAVAAINYTSAYRLLRGLPTASGYSKAASFPLPNPIVAPVADSGGDNFDILPMAV